MIRIDFEPPYPRLAERTITAITAEPGPYTGIWHATRLARRKTHGQPEQEFRKALSRHLIKDRIRFVVPERPVLVITDDELANMPPVIECAVHNAFGLLVPEMWAESPDFRVIEDGDGVNARILVRLGDPVVITDEEGPELFDILSFQAPLAFRDREDFAAAGDAYEQTVEALKWAQPQSASPKRTSVVDRISMRDGRAIEREVTPRLRAGLCLDGA